MRDVCIDELKVGKGYSVAYRGWFDGRDVQGANGWFIGLVNSELIFTNNAILTSAKYGMSKETDFRIPVGKLLSISENEMFDKEAK